MASRELREDLNDGRQEWWRRELTEHKAAEHADGIARAGEELVSQLAEELNRGRGA
jgi:hypothetical protein